MKKKNYILASGFSKEQDYDATDWVDQLEQSNFCFPTKRKKKEVTQRNQYAKQIQLTTVIP